MNFYMAPMEGLTGYIYRNAYKNYFNNVDKYFSPFIIATASNKFKTKEMMDILPENNEGVALVPQILTNKSEDFIRASKKIEQLGYNEINLNLGCPSRTVVSKNRGSGFLAKPEELDRFLDAIFSQAVTKISIKTRIGKDSPEEFVNLMKIFNKYPLEELIIHPRIQKDFYNNKPNLEVFKEALSLSSNKVCYNGDIFTTEDYNKFVKEFKSVDTIMLGRGLIKNPSLIGNIIDSKDLDKSVLKDFHDKIYEGYKGVLSGEKNVLYRMKELWLYMISVFLENEKYVKKIKKVERLSDYDKIIADLFRE